MAGKSEYSRLVVVQPSSELRLKEPLFFVQQFLAQEADFEVLPRPGWIGGIAAHIHPAAE